MTAIIFVDVELWATGYLRTALAANGYPDMFVSNRRETQPTAVWVRRDGGPTLDRLRESARLSVNVFAPTEQAADDLARTVSALLRDASDGTVRQVTQTLGPSPIADSTPRRFMTFDVICKGALL